MRRAIIMLLFAASLAGCQEGTDRMNDDSRDMSQSMAILYSHYAAEYRALTLQAYNIAEMRLLSLAASGSDVSDMAVVLDIDETVLDNSPYQARSVVDGFSYPEKWDTWCMLEEAEAIPGALRFLECADSLGFKIFYVSNRKQESVYQATLNNLRTAGFPQVSEESLLLRAARSGTNPDPSDKEARRMQIESAGYSIALLIGDNLGDFYSDNENGERRSKMVDSLRVHFGERFIVLPNAMYGNWPASIGLDGSEARQIERLDEMSRMLK